MKQMSDIYTKNVMEHFMNPRNVGEIENADAIGEVGNAKCGDIMRMYLKIDGDIITDIKFKTFGCGAAIATSSMVTEMVKGKTIAEALKVTNKDVIEALGGLPDIKIHCSVLAEEAIRDAVNNYRKKQGLAEADEGPVCTGCCDGCGSAHKEHDG
jgi:nitrogen fixation protein NifU and related proteins